MRTRNWHAVKLHMHQCCPHFFNGEHTNGDLRNKLCKLGHPQCIVPGHSFEIYEARRIAEKESKAAAKRAEREAEARKPKWTAHNQKLQGGNYNRSHLMVDNYPELTGILRSEFDSCPDGPYGVQAAMGSREDWIDWCLQLAQHPKRVSAIFEEYQKDVHVHIKTLDRLGNELDQGYQGSEGYVQALHCIFHDTFRRCHLPTPPPLNLKHAMVIRDDGVDYKSRMRAFSGYKFRAFGLIKIVVENPLLENQSCADGEEEDCSLPDIDPVEERRQFNFLDMYERRGRSYDYTYDGYVSRRNNLW